MLFDRIKENTRDQRGSKGKDAPLPIWKAFWSLFTSLLWWSDILLNRQQW